MLLGLTTYPLFYSLELSFYSYNPTRPDLGKVFVGLENYRRLLQDDLFYTALKNTLIFVAVAVGLELLIGLGLALFFSQDFKGRNLFRTALMAPLVLSPVVMGLLWLYIYHSEFGILNHVISLLGGSSVAWVADPSVALLSTILVDVWQWSPFVFVIMSAGLASLPKEAYEAALVDGASKFRIFVHISLPQLKNFFLLALLFRTIDTVKIFDIIWVLTKGGPGTSTETLTMDIYKNAFEYWHIGYASSAAYIMVGVCTVLGLMLMGAVERVTKA